MNQSINYDLHKLYSRMYFSFGIISLSPLGILINSFIQADKEWQMIIKRPVSSLIALSLALLGYNLLCGSVFMLEKLKNARSN